MSCKACGSQVSRDAAACPACGSPTKATKQGLSVKRIFLALFGCSLATCAGVRVVSCLADDEKRSPRAGEPAAEAPTREPLAFGSPTLRTNKKIGLTVVEVAATNVTDHPVTCTVRAGFLKGGKIIAAAVGPVTGLPAGQSRAIELSSTDPIAGHDEIRFTVGKCF